MKTRPPLVSIVVAAYRAGDYLRQALASVQAQTCGDFEALVADDARDEGTRAIVAALGDPRFIYHANAQTLGPAGNHWAALRRARGEFFAILNHDDLWRPEFLARMLAGLADATVAVAFCDHDIIDPAGRALPAETARLAGATGRAGLAAGRHQPFFDLAARCAVPAAQGAVFRRSALDLAALPEEAGPAYDLWLNYLLARGGGAAWYDPAPLASWRTHAGAISRAPARGDWPAGAAACWERLAEDPAFAPFRRAARRRAADCRASAALAELRGGRTRAARGHAARAVALDWTRPRHLAAYGLTLLPGALARPLLAR